MIVDLHNHTILCNHAEGSIEAYVLKAIEEKIDIFGFSDRFEDIGFYATFCVVA